MNPQICDLSDQNRPTKLGEMYSELYANEYTDAFEGLTAAGYEELEAIETLRLTLLVIYRRFVILDMTRALCCSKLLESKL